MKRARCRRLPGRPQCPEAVSGEPPGSARRTIPRVVAHALLDRTGSAVRLNMQDWRGYQEEAATFFRSLGLRAETNVRVGGARSQHDVDVLVEFERAGMTHRWVVECKAHRRPITKDRVHVLRDVVADVGADRGILLSESGFQSGARSAADLTNVRVTSLAELRSTSEEEMLDVALSSLAVRVHAAQARILALSRRDRPGSWTSPSVPRSIWPEGVLGLSGRLAILEGGVQRAQQRSFPAAYGIGDGGVMLKADRGSFVKAAAEVLEQLEPVVATLRAPKER